jgi:hypothetical protein
MPLTVGLVVELPSPTHTTRQLPVVVLEFNVTVTGDEVPVPDFDWTREIVTATPY